MLGLPKSTEIFRRLPKKALYETCPLAPAVRAKIDAAVSKMILMNEIRADNPQSQSIFVLQILLKTPNPDEKAIAAIPAVIPQRIVCVLTYGAESRLAVYHTTWLATERKKTDTWPLSLRGTTTDALWEHIVAEIGGIAETRGKTLEERIAQDARRKKLEKEIKHLERQARAECQPHRKYRLVETIKAARAEWERLGASSEPKENT